MLEKKVSHHLLSDPMESTEISRNFYVVWGAVFAGVVIAIASQMLFALIGSSIGLAVVNFEDGTNFRAIQIGALLWWIVTGAIALYAGGMVSGRMSGVTWQLDAVIHGMLTWAVTTIVTFFFLTTGLGALIAGGYGLLRAAGASVATVAPPIAEQLGNPELRNELGSLLRERGVDPQNVASIQEQIVVGVASFAMTDNPVEQKQQVVDLLTRNTNMNADEATAKVGEWAQKFQVMKEDVREQTRDAAQTASKSAAKGAFVSWVMLVIGVIVSGIGGSHGIRHWSEQIS
jgi:polyhydroxyalkanoate synthesis regulator phasin